MKVVRTGRDIIEIQLENPKEREAADYIEANMGPAYLRKWLSKLFDDKLRASKRMELQRAANQVRT